MKQHPASRVLGPRQLDAALLTVDDLPAGYRQVDFPAEILAGIMGPDASAGLSRAIPRLAGGTAAPPAIERDGRAATGQPGVPAPAGAETPMGMAVFMKGEEGPVVMQALLGTGEDFSRGLVRTIEKMLDCCSVITSDKMRITLTELSTMPRMGDASIAMAVTATVKDEGYDLTVQGNVMMLAYGDVYAEVVQVGKPDSMHDAQFKKIAVKAYRKLASA